MKFHEILVDNMVSQTNKEIDEIPHFSIEEFQASNEDYDPMDNVIKKNLGISKIYFY